MSGSFPSTWLRIPLGEISELQLGKMLDQKRTAGSALPYLRNINVRWGRIDTEDLLRMPFEDHELERYGLRVGDVLVCEGGEPGRAAVWTRQEVVKYQKALHRVRLKGNILPNWLVYQLQLDATSGSLAKHFTGTTIGHLTREALLEYQFRLAPLPEQNRIVEAIESYFTRLDDAVATLERVQRNLKRYRASVLKAAVEGRLVPTEAELARSEGRSYEPASELLKRILEERRKRWEQSGKKGRYEEPAPPETTGLRDLPEGWCWASLGQLLQLDVGFAFRSAEFKKEGLRLLRGENIEPGALRWSDVRYWDPEELSKYRHLLVEEGDILLAMDRPVVAAGLKLAKARSSDTPCLLVQRVARLRGRYVDSDFLYRVMESDRFIKHLLIGGQTGTQLPHISGARIASFRVPLPPQAEQRRLALAVDDLLSVVAASERGMDKAQRRCSRLRQSILKWAFEGKLVDQDPDDEPASALLERIRAERAASAAEPKGASRGRSTKRKTA